MSYQRCLLFTGFMFLCLWGFGQSHQVKLSLAAIQQETALPTQNNLIDEVRYFINQPISQIRQRFTRFYDFAEIKGAEAQQVFQLYLQPQLDSLKKKDKGKAAEVINQMFTHRYVFSKQGRYIVCAGDSVNVYLMFLVLPDDAQWSYARWIQQTLDLKSQVVQEKTAQGTYDKIYFEEVINGMHYPDNLALSKRKLPQNKRVSSLRFFSQPFWSTMSSLAFAELRKKMGQKAPKKTTKVDPKEELYQRALKQVPNPKDFISLSGIDKVYRHTLAELVYISPYTTLKDLADIKVSVKGGKVVYQKPGFLRIMPNRSNQPLKITFRLRTKKQRQTFIITPKSIPLFSLKTDFFKKDTEGKLLPLTENFRVAGYTRDTAGIVLPQKAYIQMSFKEYFKRDFFKSKKANQALQDSSFFRQDHRLDSRLVPQKWRLSLVRAGKTIYGRDNKAPGYIISLEDFKPKVQNGDSLVIAFTQINRLNYLNQQVLLSLKTPLTFRFLLKAAKPPLSLLFFDVAQSAEEIFKQSQLGKGEEAVFKRESNKLFGYCTELRDVKRVQIVKNGVTLLKLGPISTFLQFDKIYGEKKPQLKQMFLKHYSSRPFDTLKVHLKKYMQAFMRKNPNWKVEEDTQKKYPNQSYEEIYGQLMQFDTLFPEKDRRRYNGLGKNSVSLVYNGYAIRIYMMWWRGKGVDATISLKKENGFY